MYDIGKFHQAADVEDTAHALVKDLEAVVISGDSDVLIEIREGKLAGCSLVSIHGIKELEGIRMGEDGTIAIGPATTPSHITNNDIIQKHIPTPEGIVNTAGGPQLRNIGTISGGICNGMISADSASSLCCPGAVPVPKGPNGVREMPINRQCTGPGRAVRNHDGALMAIRIKEGNYQGYDGQYIKCGKRNATEIATPGCAVSMKLTGDKKHVQDLYLAYGAVVPTPIHCHMTEEVVKGMETGRVLAQVVGKGALEGVDPHSNWRASRESRLQLAEELGRCAVKQIVISARDEWDA